MNDPKLPSCVEPWWSNKTARDYARECVTTEDSIADALAAAEERGRRRGETERDTEWRDALCAAMGALGTSVIINNRGTEKLSALYAGNLAPRDSAPARTDAPTGPHCWCGKPSVYQSGWCGGLACQGVGYSRDSGKETT